MSRISNIGQYNLNKQDLIKIKTINDEVILFSKEEAREVLVNYINDEIELFTDDIVKVNRVSMSERVNNKLTKLESSLIQHIDDKINNITEKIVDTILNRKIEEEVNKRVELKLQKIKNAL